MVDDMKADLHHRLSEWVGMDVPTEGTEDYESWQSRAAEIDAIESIDDVAGYVDSYGITGFFDDYD